MTNNEHILSHVISHETLVLEPFFSESRLGTKIYEGNQTFIVPVKPLHCVFRSCRHYGGSFKSASNNSKLILHNRQKLPIVVTYGGGLPLVAIPMMSPKSNQNTWILFHAIVNYEATENGCLIHLKYNKSIELTVSLATVQRQISLATVLHTECINRFQRINGSPY